MTEDVVDSRIANLRSQMATSIARSREATYTKTEDSMNLFTNPLALNMTRRHFFRGAGFSLGATALAALQADEARAAAKGNQTGLHAALPETHFPGKCKHIIYLHMVGGPAQMDLYDYKPKMAEYFDKDLPDSFRMGQRLTTMTSGQARFPIAPS